MGKPVITTDSVGCRDTVEDGVTGWLVKPRDVGDLASAMAKVIALNEQNEYEMATAARARIKRDFDEASVIASYRLSLACVQGHGLRPSQFESSVTAD